MTEAYSHERAASADLAMRSGAPRSTVTFAESARFR